jgi:hypothetical protein
MHTNPSSLRTRKHELSWLSRGLFTAHKGTQEEGGVKADRKGEKTAGKRGRKAFFFLWYGRSRSKARSLQKRERKATTAQPANGKRIEMAAAAPARARIK